MREARLRVRYNGGHGTAFEAHTIVVKTQVPPCGAVRGAFGAFGMYNSSVTFCFVLLPGAPIPVVSAEKEANSQS